MKAESQNIGGQIIKEKKKKKSLGVRISMGLNRIAKIAKVSHPRDYLYVMTNGVEHIGYKIKPPM